MIKIFSFFKFKIQNLESKIVSELLFRSGTNYIVAGVGGFEPPNAGSKNPCLTT